MKYDAGLIKKQWGRGALFVCALSFALHAFAAPYVELKNGTKKAGTNIRAKADGSIVLTTDAGPITYSKAQVLRAVADKPAGWDQAVTAYEAGQYDKVIAPFKEVLSKYKFLGWDGLAAPMLAMAQLKTGDAASALRTLEGVFEREPEQAKNPELQIAHWKALEGAGKKATLKPLLDKAIAGGDRNAAAHAQIIRGDIKLSESAHEEAVLDYLRTVTLFKKEAAAQPEALYKAATTLETLKDGRARQFYRTLVEQYPNSEYAEKAKSKI